MYFTLKFNNHSIMEHYKVHEMLVGIWGRSNITICAAAWEQPLGVVR